MVHAVTYSILLLNTDLHVVDSASRMTRQQFVRNTLEAVRAQAEAAEAGTIPSLLFGADKVSAEPAADTPADASPGVGDREDLSSRTSLDQTSRYRKALVDRVPEDSPSSSSLNLPVSPAMSRSATAASARAVDSPARASLRSESAVTLSSTVSHRSLEASLPGVLKASLISRGPRLLDAPLTIGSPTRTCTTPSKCIQYINSLATRAQG